MAETGSVKVTIDDESIRARMRQELAKAWEEGCEAGMGMAAESFWRPDNPYRAL